MLSKSSRILFLSAHTDDCEIGMGGTIDRLVKLGCPIKWITFCNAWQSLPKGWEKNTLLEEQRSTVKHFGLHQDSLDIHDIPVRQFPNFRQSILEELVTAGRSFQPDIIFCPSLQDNHQDHNTLAREARRAFKNKTVIGYILPWNIQVEVRNIQIEISEENLNKKIQAVAMYKSQAHRSYLGAEEIWTLARANGIQSGFRFSEQFELIKLSLSV